MKCTGQLVMALDFRRDKSIVPHKYSFQKDGNWYVVHVGQKYQNTFKITEFDDEALKELRRIENAMPSA